MDMATLPTTEPYAEGSVDLIDYVRVLRRSWRLIALVIVLMVGLASAYSFTRVKQYTATAKLQVLPTLVNLSDSAVAGQDKLVNMPTAADVAKSIEVATVAKELMNAPTTPSGLRVTGTPQDLLKRISVSIVPDSQILAISFTDPKPQRAQLGAQSFADAYIRYSSKYAQDRVNQQLAEYDAQRRDLLDERKGLEQSDPRYQDISSLIQYLDTQKLTQFGLNTNAGEIPTPAQLPIAPSSPKHPLNLALGFFFGLFLGVTLAFVRSRADDRLRERPQLEASMGAPVLAVIPRVPGWTDGSRPHLVALEDPMGPASEAYRALRTSVLVNAMQRNIKVILVVSPTQGEGKTTTAANLAVTLAQADRTVVLVSADLRRPRLHEFFDIPNERGLADVLAGKTPTWESLKRSSLDNLWVLPSGSVPTNPAELLQSDRMREILEEQRAVVDFVIIDCPPVLQVSDALGLVPMSDAVLFVADAKSTRKGAADQARQQLEQVGATFIGSVLNAFEKGGTRDYYGYGYVGENGSGPSTNGSKPTTSRRRHRSRS
jgi:capsular exopolysaccharide synthesis family protein